MSSFAWPRYLILVVLFFGLEKGYIEFRKQTVWSANSTTDVINTVLQMGKFVALIQHQGTKLLRYRRTLRDKETTSLV